MLLAFFEQLGECFDSHGGVLFGWVGFAVAFVDDDWVGGFVVGGFDFGFFYPACKCCAGGVFAFDGDAFAVVSDAPDVALICGAGFDAAVYAVVDVVGEVVGDDSFEL